jgi:nucleoside 2-deoxyribosyltransferase
MKGRESLNNILKNTRAYLAGHIQYADGYTWRQNIKKSLQELNIIPFDPLDKPFINNAPEDKSIHSKLRSDMDSGNLKSVKEFISTVRRQDLSMIDKSDMIICHIYPERASWGTAEELCLAEKTLKPTFISVDGGITKTPYWLLAMFDISCFYNNLNEILQDLSKINSGEKQLDEKYWKILKHEYR